MGVQLLLKVGVQQAAASLGDSKKPIDLPMKKAFKNLSLKAFKLSTGRCERIRTFDPLHPMQVRYQAAPHTEIKSNYSL